MDKEDVAPKHKIKIHNNESNTYHICKREIPSHSLKDSNVSLKVKTSEEGVEVCFLTRNISRVEGCVETMG
jgi:hypothetical protein